MIIPATEDQAMIDLSPYGEWNWSMMGFAGRDPIFYAQLESEVSIHNSGDLPETIQNLCFRCHGVMGQRQFHLDDAGDTFTRDIVHVTDPADPNCKYGALAREGISCMVCHQIVDEGKPTQETMTGQFDVAPAGAEGNGISRIFGPFEDPATLPMVSSLGMKPLHGEPIKTSRLCGSCHTIYLPIFDADGNQVGSDFEQTTYQELVKNPENRFTTSFVAQATTIKDKRLLPKGWTKEGPPGFAADPTWGLRFVAATSPKGKVLDDVAFQDGSGSDRIVYQIDLPEEDIAGGTVEATLYYQSIPPFYLLERFSTAHGPNAQRLHFMASYLNVDGTPIENWKLEVAAAQQAFDGDT